MIQVLEDKKWVTISTNSMLVLMVKHAHKSPKSTEFMIGDIFYKIGDEVTDEIRDAFKKEKMWETLSAV